MKLLKIYDIVDSELNNDYVKFRIELLDESYRGFTQKTGQPICTLPNGIRIKSWHEPEVRMNEKDIFINGTSRSNDSKPLFLRKDVFISFRRKLASKFKLEKL